ncbi:hypothetical protein VT84_23950 [Gemmata sp. SH-PL17]|uniref:hypothetical protein n=1 Tax=Gemmata sp. SH-PL17 TaxID=1630693 RepID=UPI0004B46237|nr:hypothetical protein [Gemmata sp. SH-PL17]AMV27475.1 hypothetical protein VT84_23950 [Gemmata sp. SH-PL17]
MTEAEWLACVDPDPMLWYLNKLNRWEHTEVSERKLRLLACAFCRRIWHLMPDELSRATVELCEHYVDGLADPQPLWARGGISTVVQEHAYGTDTVEHEAYFAARFVGNQIDFLTGPTACWAEQGAADFASYCAARADAFSGRPAEESAKSHCHIIRDVIGNPFRRVVDAPECTSDRGTFVRYQPIAIDPSWRTSTAVALASQMYESRDFGAMPILGDALQDAGCDSADVLGHCRGPGPHVRGCWVVDLVLGKE